MGALASNWPKGRDRRDLTQMGQLSARMARIPYTKLTRWRSRASSLALGSARARAAGLRGNALARAAEGILSAGVGRRGRRQTPSRCRRVDDAARRDPARRLGGRSLWREARG